MEQLFNLPAEINTDGTIKYDKIQFRNACENLKKPETRDVRILIIQDYSQATRKQLAYYHGILLKDVIYAFQSIGERLSEKEVDEIVRKLFLSYYKTNISTGKKVKVSRSLDSNSHDFPSTKQISLFFEDIVKYCAENMNYIVYLPSDFKYINLNFDR